MSSPFSSGNSSSSTRSSTASSTPAPNNDDIKQQQSSSLNLPSVTTGNLQKPHHQSSSSSSPTDDNNAAATPTAVPPDNNASSSYFKKESESSNNNPTITTTNSDDDNNIDPELSNKTTSTIKPGLLSVYIESATGLSLPPSIASLSPGTNNVGLAQSLSTAGSISPRKQQPNQQEPQQQKQDQHTDQQTSSSSNQGSPSKNASSSTTRRRPPVYLVLEYDKTQVILDASGGSVDNPLWDKVSNFDVSRLEKLSIQIYTRVPISSSSAIAALNSYSEQANSPFISSTPLSSSSMNRGGGSHHQRRKYEDVFLGSCKIAADSSDLNNLKNNNNILVDGWQSLSSGSGKIKLQIGFQPNKDKQLNIEEFDLLKVIGKGSFGKVMQVRKHDTSRVYALKTIRKAHIISRSEVNHTLAERTVLAQIDNPFIVPLKFSFQSPEKLYLVLAFVNGGELFHHLQREGRFDLNRARFYTAELLCALECLHEFNVIYRDLKPENILLDYTGHIALCDFGLCKLNMEGQEKTNTFCGTPEYLAPELLLGQGYSKVVDWWTLGVLFYEMLTGLPPFYDQDTNEMYRKILQDPLRFPDDMDREARSLLQGLLIRDPKKRLGINGASEIKSHPFFAQIDWKRLMAKKYAAPFKPAVESATDTSNFDQEFTSEEPTDSVVDKDFYLSESAQQQFGGWTYTNTDSKLAGSGRF